MECSKQLKANFKNITKDEIGFNYLKNIQKIYNILDKFLIESNRSKDDNNTIEEIKTMNKFIDEDKNLIEKIKNLTEQNKKLQERVHILEISKKVNLSSK